METTLLKKKKKLVGESNLIKKQKGKLKRCKLPGPETLKRQRRLETSAFEQALKARKSLSREGKMNVTCTIFLALGGNHG